MRTRVKICGITRPGDAREAAALGADALGLVFHPASPRCVTLERAREIASSVPPFVTLVALFMDPEPGMVEPVLERLRPDLLQFHGDERAADCERYGWPYIKAVPMAGGTDVRRYAQGHPEAKALLLDAHAAGQPGGSGRAFDWSAVPGGLDRPVILAGGLTPDNVHQAVRQVRPYAVDVSSGVESAPGVKDPDRMATFLNEVQRVSCQRQ